ncbi:MAG: enoyl-CoA hydratase-related protein [Syntrophomonadaceae bacterium]|nr:enoyl-CoA hydratase-related protein [Syntrophomonadaceae bacterium]
MSFLEKEFKTMKAEMLPDVEGVCLVTLNRPKAFNAINDRLLDECLEILTGIQEDPNIKVFIVTGDDNAFAAGADLKQVYAFNGFQARDYDDKVHRTLFALEDNHKPSIAAVRGLALGGGMELTLGCDMRVVSETATMGLPEINIGIFPGGGATQRLPRQVSLGLAKELVYMGDFFDGKKAGEYGLANYVVPAEEVMPLAIKLAKKITRKPPLAIREAKNALNMSMNTDIKTGCRMEQLGWSLCFSSEDQKEGMGAFVEKRKAEFKGK